MFELNLGDPDVLASVRNGLNAGVLGFAITSLPEPGVAAALAAGSPRSESDANGHDPHRGAPPHCGSMC